MFFVEVCPRVCILHPPLAWRHGKRISYYLSKIPMIRVRAKVPRLSDSRAPFEDDEHDEEAIAVGTSKPASTCWWLHAVCMRMTSWPLWPFSNLWPKEGVVVNGGRERLSRRLQEANPPDQIILPSLPSFGFLFVIDG
jgi:hypothetical protein